MAAEWAGFETVAQCEIDEYASKVLAKNFKGVPNLHDIRTVTNERLAEFGINGKEIAVVSAGFPCQPYSLAGKGHGDCDSRDLWGEVARVHGLATYVKMYPTPMATQRGDCPAERRRHSPCLESVVAMQEPNGGKLNPTWVEWLMNFPIGWTDLDASEMQ